MSPDPHALLADIRSAAADIERFTDGMNCETYTGDARTQAAVERKFQIIGGALDRLRKSHPEIAEQIPSVHKVVGFRNLLIHNDSFVVSERVWDYAKQDLPRLREIVEALLDELGPPDQ